MELVQGQNERWSMHKAIFYNFWYYPNQELIFKDGTAVLRGHNGSGKSVTTQTLITVLLDGNISPNRLDPFGGKERTIAETLLGEKGLLGIDKRIGYVAMEFKKGDSMVTKTIGMAISADRELKKTETWYFIINGKRIGQEATNLRLYKEVKTEGKTVKQPLTEKELRIEIEQQLQCGKVYNKRDEYAQSVNKNLFGFEGLQEYQSLMDLLLQLRSPKLSDQNKPEEAANVLNDSLPQLTDDELRPLISSIESIDRLEKDLQNYRKDLRSVESLNNVYVKYNQLAAAENAKEYLNYLKRLEDAKEQYRESQSSSLIKAEELAKTKGTIRKVVDEIEVLKQEKADLGVAEVETIQEKKQEAEESLRQIESKVTTKNKKKQEAEKRHDQYQTKFQKLERELSEKQRELNGYLLEVENIAYAMDYKEHKRFYDNFVHNQETENYSFIAWDASFKNYKNLIQKCKNQLVEREMLESRISEVENTVGLLQMKIDNTRLQIAQKENEWSNCVSTLRDEIASWDEESMALDLPIDVVENLMGNIEEVYSTVSIKDFMHEVTAHEKTKKDILHSETVRTQMQLEQINLQIKEMKEQLVSVEAQREIEPLFINKKKAAWERISDIGLEWYPFYEAFEFNEGVSHTDQLAIQNGLHEIGLLSSVVLNPMDVEEASSETIVAKYGSEKTHNLTEIMHSPINPLFENILRSISYEKNDNGFILSDGTVSNGFAYGKSAPFDNVLYIGKAAREKHRQNVILDLNNRLEEVEFDQQCLIHSIQQSKEQLNVLDQEMKKFPQVEKIETILSAISNEKRRIEEVFEVEISEKNDALLRLRDESAEIVKKIQPFINGSELSLSLEAFSTELEHIEDYSNCLMDIMNAYKDLSWSVRQVEEQKSSAQLQKDQAEELHQEILEVVREKDKLLNMIESYSNVLKEIGSADILKRVEELTRLINRTLPDKKDTLLREEVKLERDLSELKDELERLQNETLPFERAMLDAWEKAFVGLMKTESIHTDDEFVELPDRARFVVKKFGEQLDKKRTAIEKTKKTLRDRFMEKSVELVSYELAMNEIESDSLVGLVAVNDLQENAIAVANEQMRRITVTMTHDDLRYSPMEVAAKLANKISEIEQDANEKDLQLYESILINTLGDSIRRKIQYVEQWEKQMNNYMEHKNIIKFRIKWVPKKSDNPNEMDTQKLVEALKKNVRWLNPEDIAKHFRSKIKEAKRAYHKDTDVNLKDVMKKVLDYRDWFEFEIYFTKQNDSEYRLTRTTYGHLSGGQRVLAMVTPVLAALYAKYTEARPDAPKLFTLDEAFSRVDDVNINIMFEYIHKLGFNYIVNSQSLWGCFASVPSLNIYELSRPNNRPFVSINSYYWNGYKRINMEDLRPERAVSKELVNT